MHKSPDGSVLIVLALRPAPPTSAIVPGTPLYIAPERLRDPSSASPATNIYSLGVVAFGMLTGKEPFCGDSTTQLVYHAITTPAPRINACVEVALPDTLETLVARCLEKDPARRPASVREMIGILETAADLHSWTRNEASAWWRDNGARFGVAGDQEARGEAAS